ncbi:MAG: pyridoxal phosphate-dependent aminotransferase [Oscillospiraceae bacterium]|nr:pyridoxal phosphate-dependent aminotransferase [Oscillospiraceae bacterium]
MNTGRMRELGEKRSVIRELFEYGNKRKAEIGPENVFDFSIGNPSVPAPKEFSDELCRMLSEESPLALHSYTSAPGDLSARKSIADDLNERFGTSFGPENLYMTCGAAASLTISLSAVVGDGEEVILFAPFFPEYTVFVETAGGKPVTVPCRWPDFQIDFEKLSEVLNEKTAAVIINSPNNPSGAVFSEDSIKKLSSILSEAEEKFGRKIYLISDEPYRELVYGEIKVPFVTKYYNDTIICYSWSKSLSLPGERIGYILVSPENPDWKEVYSGICGAGRALGFVCAPSLFQHMIPKCIKMTSDISVYKKNRDLLYGALSDLGFEAVHPDGAFYLFVKSPEPDAKAFSEKAKKHELLIVPSDDFGMEGFVRISYCVSTEQIERSLPAFKKLAEEYSL